MTRSGRPQGIRFLGSGAAAAIGGGALLWIATMIISGRREAWDASFYWSITYPLSIGLAGFTGYRLPVKAWRWGLLVMLGQAAVLVFSSGSFGLLPLGLFMFLILSVPAMLVALLMAWVRQRRARG